MRNLPSLLALGAMACFSRQITAQASDIAGCPHLTIERVEATMRGANTVPCGSGVQVNIGGVQYTSPPGTCTLLIIYTPEHWIPKPSAGSNTYAQPLGVVRDHIFRFTCKVVRFLWIIPIDGTCIELPASFGDEIPNYAVYPCRR